VCGLIVDFPVRNQRVGVNGAIIGRFHGQFGCNVQSPLAQHAVAQGIPESIESQENQDAASMR
jgi:hypothetical protein